jgi:cytochrome c-type biogenesis protein CcmH/NrfG
LLSARQDFSAASDLFREAVRLDPNSYQAWYHLANTLMQQKDAPNPAEMIADAVAAYRKVVDINPVVAQAHFELGMSVLIAFGAPKRRTHAPAITHLTALPYRALVHATSCAQMHTRAL